jgi:hypothetical protein
MVVFLSYVNVYQRVIFPVLGIPWYTHFKDSYCGMTMAHMLPSQPAHLPNIYEWMALSETGIPRSLMMNHHFPIIFPSVSHHFPSGHGKFCGSTPSFFFRIPVVGSSHDPWGNWVLPSESQAFGSPLLWAAGGGSISSHCFHPAGDDHRDDLWQKRMGSYWFDDLMKQLAIDRTIGFGGPIFDCNIFGPNVAVFQ